MILITWLEWLAAPEKPITVQGRSMFGYIASFTNLCSLFLMIDMEFFQDDFKITLQ